MTLSANSNSWLSNTFANVVRSGVSGLTTGTLGVNRAFNIGTWSQASNIDCISMRLPSLVANNFGNNRMSFSSEMSLAVSIGNWRNSDLASQPFQDINQRI